MRKSATPYLLVVLTVLNGTCLSAQVAVTIASNVNAQPFTVTGTGCAPGNYTAPQTLPWTPGASCSVAFPSPYSAQAGIRYNFSAWQDADISNPRTFVAPAQAVTLTATFATQFYLTVQVSSPQGGTAAGEGWYGAGTEATISATPATGYQFINWAFDRGNPPFTGNPATINMNAPRTAVANFRPITTAPPNRYTVVPLAAGAYLYGQNQMNDFGQVVGYFGSGVFLWTPSSANGILGMPQSLPGAAWDAAINTIGEIATGSSEGLTLWLPEKPNSAALTQTVLSLGPVFVSALNEFGQVGGQFNGKAGIWTPGNPNGTTGTLTLNDQFRGLVAMNRFGQAITHGSLFTPSSANGVTGTFTPIPGPPGATGATLVAINDNGTVLGYSCPSNPGFSQGFLWTPDSPNSSSGSVTPIPSTPGTSMSPTAMNAQGDVVGTIAYSSASFPFVNYSSQSFPFLYTGGALYELSGVDVLLARSTPRAINSAGQIGANGGPPYYGAVLATPSLTPPAPPPNAVPVTIAIAGQPFTVTGTGCSEGSYTGTPTLQWTPGATCVVAFGSPYSTSFTTRYVFKAWQDGDTSNPRTFRTPSQAASYTANFDTQYLVTGHAAIPGTGTVTGGGWVTENAAVTLTAVPARGYMFVRWGTGTVATLTITATYPADPVADFDVLAAPGNYTFTLITRQSYGAYLNDYGQIAGLNDDFNVASPYLWTPLTPNGTLGNLTVVSPPPLLGSWNVIWGLNNQGQVLGTTQAANAAQREVFLWTPTSPNSSDGTAVAISSLNPAPFAIPALSNYGEVVGSLNGSWGIWTPGTANGTTGTNIANSAFAGAVGINSSGQIIINRPQSDSSTLPVLFKPSSPHAGTGTFTIIPGLSGYPWTKLVAINENGTVAGYSCTPSTYSPSCTTTQGFIWTPDAPNGTTGATVPIPLSGGVLSVQPAGLNNLGDMVGTITKPNTGGGTPIYSPFLFTKGALYDLRNLSGEPQYASAVGINSAGQIVFNSGQSIYLATPTPPAPAPPKNAVPVTIASNTTGQAFAVTGTGCAAGSYRTPQVLEWTPGAVCVVTFLSPYSDLVQTRTLFKGWQDGNTSNPRTLATPAAAATYTANFDTQYYATVEANLPGVGPIGGSGWYAAKSTVALAVTEVPGYKFVGPSNPLIVTLNYVTTVIAYYVPAASVAPGNYSITTVAAKGSAAGMNEFGQVAGTDAGVPFLWTPTSSNGTLGSLIDLADFATSTTPVGGIAINDVGQVMGLDNRNNAGWAGVFLWSPDSPNESTGTLSELPLYFLENFLHGNPSLNNYGQIGGFINGQGAIWTPSAPNAASGAIFANPAWTYLKAMNGFGQAVSGGYYPLDKLVLFTPFTANGNTGTFTPLPVVVSTQLGAWAAAAAISEDGSIVGHTTCEAGADCSTEGFLWKPATPHGTSGSLTLIPPLPGFSSLRPAAINSKGDIVGDMAGVPFLYTNGAVYALAALSDFTAGASPVAINSAGQILFNSAAGAYLATLNTPPPAPTNAVLVTITANAALSFSVTGDGCSAGVYPLPQTLKWMRGATCTIAFLSPDTALNTRYVFSGWQDGNTSDPRTFIAPSQAATYTASFKAQVYVAALVQPARSGTVTGAGWYDLSSTVTLNAVPADGYAFLKWTSSSGSFTDNPLTLTANIPQTFTAMFTTVTIPVTGSYTLTLIAKSGTGAKLNDFGQVAGSFLSAGGFLWTPSSPNDVLGSVDAIPGMDRAVGLNSIGEVAGSNNSGQVLLWSPAAPNTGTGNTVSIALPCCGLVTALNDFGQIGGYWGGAGSIWTPDQPNGTTGTAVSDAHFAALVAMNSYGQAIMNGGSTSQTYPTWAPLLFTPSTANSGSGTFTSVPGLDGSTQVTLKAIGPDGTILGYGCMPLAGSCLNQGFFWVPDVANSSTGTSTAIPMPANIAAMTPVAMNSNREVIGTMQEASGGIVPFLYEQGVVYDLTPLVSSIRPATPVVINKAGQILFNGMGGVYLATPVRP
ncbi:MAG TPA: hypothetical protein VEU96_27400 [Bryobacteraceae bacterium]|nr:hypothetical protein [Bryobacteraceae bacterium]